MFLLSPAKLNKSILFNNFHTQRMKNIALCPGNLNITKKKFLLNFFFESKKNPLSPPLLMAWHGN